MDHKIFGESFLTLEVMEPSVLVDWAYRTGRKSDSRPITVEFRNIKDRNRVFQAKDKLQSDRYFISDCSSVDCLRAHY